MYIKMYIKMYTYYYYLNIYYILKYHIFQSIDLNLFPDVFNQAFFADLWNWCANVIEC